jgi:dTDP-4-dehydrorhamnose reductase
MTNQRVLITGGSGLLGRYLRASKPDNLDMTSTRYCNNQDIFSEWRLDITNMDEVIHVFALYKPTVVIHTVAMTDVDLCEKFRDLSDKVNVEGTKNIVLACNKFKSALVYLSTNAVFSGENPPYKEDDEQCPLSEYGLTKKRAENHIVTTMNGFLIIRTMWLYGWPHPGGRQNWVTNTIRKFNNNEKMRVVDDVINQPTYAGDVADAIWKLLQRNAQGIYHVAGDEFMSLYQFVDNVMKVFDLKGILEPCKSSEFSDIARRPASTVFDLSKLNNEGIYTRDVNEGLNRMRNYYDI